MPCAFVVTRGLSTRRRAHNRALLYEGMHKSTLTFRLISTPFPPLRTPQVISVISDMIFAFDGRAGPPEQVTSQSEANSSDRSGGSGSGSGSGSDSTRSKQPGARSAGLVDGADRSGSDHRSGSGSGGCSGGGGGGGGRSSDKSVTIKAPLSDSGSSGGSSSKLAPPRSNAPYAIAYAGGGVDVALQYDQSELIGQSVSE